MAGSAIPVSRPELPSLLRVALGAYAARLRMQLGPRLRGLRLFGSWARSQATTRSDVDVWVLVDRFDALTRDAPFDAAQATLFEHGVDLTPTVMDEAQWRHLLGRERRIALDIEREGFPL